MAKATKKNEPGRMPDGVQRSRYTELMKKKPPKRDDDTDDEDSHEEDGGDEDE